MRGTCVEAEGFGELVVQMRPWPFRSFEDELLVKHADPRILITEELLDEIANSDGRLASLKDDVLTIKGSNRRVIYRIGEYVPDRRAYVAEWPD
jgi:hypothetical protein